MVRILSIALIGALATTQQVLAQGNNPPPASSGTTAPATTGNQPASSGTSNGQSSGTTAASTNPSNTGTTAPATSATSARTSAASTGSTTNPPPAASSTGTSPPLPTLSGVLPPPLIVPDTSGAPFMQKSNLPEGTVFIAVGAALGFLGLCVLIWRALIAWSLRRSVQRAAHGAYAPDTKSMFGFGAGAGYKSMYTDSNMSLEQLPSTNTGYMGAAATKPAASGGQDRRTSKQPRATSRTPSNLFFSPTAGAGSSAGAPQQSSARASTMLPSGYYASNAPNAGYARAQQTPPDSPGLHPQGSHLRPSSGHGPRQSMGTSRLSTSALNSQDQRRSRQPSAQNLSVASPTQGRTPSAHFETLLDIHGHGPSERF